MRARCVWLLLVLGALSGCRSVNRLCFPGDDGQNGPNDFESWELRRDLQKDLQRSEHDHGMSTMRNPWDDMRNPWDEWW